VANGVNRQTGLTTTSEGSNVVLINEPEASELSFS